MYIAGAFGIIPVTDFANARRPRAKLQSRGGINIFYSGYVDEETFSMLQEMRKAKLFFLYKFMVKVYFCSVACFYVLPLSEKSNEIHIK